MFSVHIPRNSQEAYKGARLLVDLHDAGVGLCEAARALEPLAEAMWSLIRLQQEEDDDFDIPYAANLRVDRSVKVICEDINLDGEWECMSILITCPGRFDIHLWCQAWEEGEFIAFDDSNPVISLDAADVNELATFLVLARLHGGDLEVDPEGT